VGVGAEVDGFSVGEGVVGDADGFVEGSAVGVAVGFVEGSAVGDVEGRFVGC